MAADYGPGVVHEDVEVITDPAEIRRIRDLWAEIQANPQEPDDVDALLAKLRALARN